VRLMNGRGSAPLSSSLTSAFRLCWSWASAGDGDCCCLLAVCFHNGLGTAKNVVERDRWLMESVVKGSRLGAAYEAHYRGDHEAALPLLHEFAHNHSDPRKRDDDDEEEEKEEEEEEEEEEREEEEEENRSKEQRGKGMEREKSGISIVQNTLGYCYYIGLGVPKDETKGVEYYTLAARQGFPGALCNAARATELGIGTPMDQRAARDMYERASRCDFPVAVFHLARCFEEGIGGDMDVTQALRLYEKAEAMGYERSAEAVKRLRALVHRDA
jgi:TPR repeat protein